MEFIVDIQGFTANNRDFIPKEIAVISRNGEKLQHYLLEPPYDWNQLNKSRQKETQWLLDNYHGLYWDSGFCDYSHTLHHIEDELSNASKIFVKGARKKKFLENNLNLSAIIIDLVQYPSLKLCNTINFSCLSHSPPFICALRNVFVIKYWLDLLTPNTM